MEGLRVCNYLFSINYKICKAEVTPGLILLILNGLDLKKAQEPHTEAQICNNEEKKNQNNKTKQ